MNGSTKKKAMVYMAIGAIVISRLFFLFLNDPEGPNLFIVTVVAMGIYGIVSFVFLQ